MRRRNLVWCLVATSGLAVPGAADAQQSVHLQPQAADVTGTGDCCVPFNGSPGCNDAECEAQVCASLDNEVCCTDTWDAICADSAADMCSLLCEASTNDCCVSRRSPGCGNVACEEIICGADPFCCTSFWDSTCVEQAVAECGDLCVIEGDCAIDFDLTLDDYAILFECVTGPAGGPPEYDCTCTDLDGDSDVDIVDWSLLQPLLGP
jgi:hypothetical protein